jgi:hypothetical protein
VKILGIDEIVSALLGEPLVLGEGQAIESPEEEFEGEQQDIKDDRYGNSNLKHGKATPLAPERGVPGGGPQACEEQPERGSEETEWRRRHI